MRKLISIWTAVTILLLLLAVPLQAASLGIGPSHTELEVPGNGNTTAQFQVHYFSGNLEVNLVDIPLRVEPQIVHVEASGKPVDIELIIYGDESLGSQVYDGYIRFLGITEGTVAVAVKVKAKVTNIVEGQPIPQETIVETPEETILLTPVPEPTPTEIPSSLPFEWYVYALIGAAIPTIIITIKVVVDRRS